MTLLLRPVTDADLAALLEINTAAAPAVNVIPPDELAELVADSVLALTADDGEPAGLLIALPPGLDYASENYAWFLKRAEAAGTDFLYVDRMGSRDRARPAARRTTAGRRGHVPSGPTGALSP